MLIGTHAIIYSTKPDADRAFLRDVFKLPHVDAGKGWLIFSVPPAELAVHPAEHNDVHEFYFMCDDVEGLMAELQAHNIACGPVQNQGWGLLTRITLPGGGKVGVYQPLHVRPKPISTKAPKKAKKTARKTRRGQPRRR